MTIPAVLALCSQQRPRDLATQLIPRLIPRLIWRMTSGLLLGLLLSILSSCAGFSAERHLAPVFSEYSTAGGGGEIEALGGAVLRTEESPRGRDTRWALRPFSIQDWQEDGSWRNEFIFPLGTATKEPDERLVQLLPVFRYASSIDTEGRSRWTLLTLPGIYWAQLPSGRRVRAFFPFGGVVENSLSFDRLTFFMFPLYAHSERAGRENWNFLWPIFGYTSGRGGKSWRLWPIASHQKFEGVYDRRFVLWPIFHKSKNHLNLPESSQESKWLLFPFYGQTKRGSFKSRTLLWPFFGWSSDAETGFWAWDGPFPLVRIQRPGDSGAGYRTRVWPFYSYFEGDGLTSTWYGWPIFNRSHEDTLHYEKDATSVNPFWQSWVRTNREGRVDFYRKLWPLGRHERVAGREEFAWPALSPIWRSPRLNQHYAWMWEIYQSSRTRETKRERSWLGLWRREKDRFEDRKSLVGLWSRRKFTKSGNPTTETSMFFGLLRWRSSHERGLGLMLPAFPGPGWPLERSQEER